MKRRIMDELVHWKDKKDRKPLLMTGVRQCGKTYILKEFGRLEFKNTLYVNFDKGEDLTVFDGVLDPRRIITELSGRHNVRIDSDTMIIFDEIQGCPRAMSSLKYFCEEMPEQPIAAAGSLLGVAIQSGTGFPVGKVDSIVMRPMDFGEFLAACGNDMMAEQLSSDISAGIPSSYESLLETRLREYMIVGGMPEAVRSWVENRDYEDVENIQNNILSNYKDDISRHAPADQMAKIFGIWHSIPQQLAVDNAKFMFSHASKGGRARELEDSLQWLVSAGLVIRVERVERPSHPLRLSCNRSVFKIYLCDVGLLGRMMGLTSGDMLSDSFDDMCKGALAENLVAIECHSIHGEAYYWRDGKAELDFLLDHRGNVIPIEIKAGRRIRARSLGRYMDAYGPRIAAVVSMNPLGYGRVTHIPLYAVWLLDRILEAAEAASDEDMS